MVDFKIKGKKKMFFIREIQVIGFKNNKKQVDKSYSS